VISFDENWYITQHPEIAEELQRGDWSTPIAHYHQKGAKKGLSPNTYFDEEWYRSKYPDVVALLQSGEFQSGFHHYLVRGISEGRNPLAGFDERFYLDKHADVRHAVESGIYRSGYDHYLRSGAFEGRPATPDETPPAPATPSYTPVATQMPLLLPLRVEVLPQSRATPRLNIVLPSLQMRHMSGGPNTALNVGCRLACQGVPVRFLSSNVPLESDLEPLRKHIAKLGDVAALPPDVQISDGSTASTPAVIGDGDIFFATAWWTAQMISYVLPQMQSRRFIYLVQDFEPGLSAWSSEYSMALETYSMDMLPVVNTELLYDYFVTNRIGAFADSAIRESAVWFEPAIDTTHFRPEPRAHARQKRLLFYARPTLAQRNLFELGLCALKRVADEGAFGAPGEWDLRYIGEPLPATELAPGIQIHPCPWLTFSRYAHLMRQSDILLSLMLSPHPSYPPLEMAACGGLVVTNSFDCKTRDRLHLYSDRILAAKPFVASIAENLRTAIRTAGEPFSFHPVRVPKTWDESLRPVIRKLRQYWHTVQS
jgi:hypothetical protein